MPEYGVPRENSFTVNVEVMKSLNNKGTNNRTRIALKKTYFFCTLKAFNSRNMSPRSTGKMR